jgi:hypothetical protein
MTLRESGMMAVVCAVLAGCGGGGGSSGHVCDGANTTPPDLGADFAPNFVATWIGDMTVNGSPAGTVQLPITRKATNKLDLGDVCPHGGIPALVESASTFESVCFVCSPTKIGDCGSVVATYEFGSGELLSGDLEFTASGFMDGCGTQVDFDIDFQSFSSGSVRELTLPGAPPPAPAPSLAEALAAAFSR